MSHDSACRAWRVDFYALTWDYVEAYNLLGSIMTRSPLKGHAGNFRLNGHGSDQVLRNRRAGGRGREAGCRRGARCDHRQGRVAESMGEGAVSGRVESVALHK